MAKCTARLESGVNILGHQFFDKRQPVCVSKTNQSSQGMIEDGPILCDVPRGDPSKCDHVKQMADRARVSKLDFSI